MLYFAGLLQSPGQRQAAQAACDRQGQVLQPTGRGEDQGSGRSLRADGITILSVCFCRNKLYKWKLVCVCNFFFSPPLLSCNLIGMETEEMLLILIERCEEQRKLFHVRKSPGSSALLVLSL